MSAPAQAGAPGTARATRLLGYGLAIIFLFWVLHDFHPVKALRDFSNVSWKWVLLGVLFDVISYAIQGARWKYLLRPFGRVRLYRSARAVFAGLFANLIFPLRPGEVLRAYLLSTSEEIGFGRVLGSVGVERLIDLVVATAALAVVSLFVPLPARFQTVADLLAIVTLALLAVFIAIILYFEYRLTGDPASLATVGSGRAAGKLMPALVGLHAMGTSPSFYLAVLFSLLMPFFQILGLWSMMRSYGLQLPFLSAVVVLFVINLGVSLPNAPGNVGSYQFFCVLGLSIFQIEKTTAAGFSIFAFVAMTLPFLFLGFAAMMRSGLSLGAMREQIRRLPAEGRKSPA